MKSLKENINLVPQLSEEMNFIIFLLREEITQDEIEKWKLKKINWEAFVQLALHHRVYPLLYVKLNKLKFYFVPEHVMEILHKSYQQNAFAMLELTSEMERIGRLFENNGIQAIFLKGPILADEIYGDIALRTSKDLDILVSINCIKATEELLKDSGYIKKKEKIILNEKKWRIHHSVFLHPIYKFSIEIHWRLNDRPDKEPIFNVLWERRRISKLTGQPLNILGEEDLFLYLVSHGARHGWFRLRWLLDTDRLLQRGLIWDKYKHIIKDYSNELLVGQTLILTNRLFNTPINTEFKGLLVNKSYLLANMAIKFIKGSEINQPFPKELIPYHQYYTWVLQKNIIQKIKYFMILSYPTYKDSQLLRLPKKIHFLYFPLRPFLFVGRKIKLLKFDEN